MTIDTLLKHGFKPRRTIVVAWGIDEEASGLQVNYRFPFSLVSSTSSHHTYLYSPHQGAGNLGPYLEKTYGKDGFAMLVDEGGTLSSCIAVGPDYDTDVSTV